MWVAGLVVFLVVGGATGALASHLADKALSASTTGASFSGNWQWYANGESCGAGCMGGWQRWGTLRDTNCADGNGVFDEARVEGYGFSSRYYAPQCQSVSLNNVFYDPQATVVTHAEWHICRDRGILYPDNCSTLKHFTRSA